jgi:hypothetical protein
MQKSTLKASFQDRFLLIADRRAPAERDCPFTAAKERRQNANKPDSV